MIYKEINTDLFEYYNKGYYLVHCISADFKLGAGIAKEFDRRFNLREELISSYGNDWWRLFDDVFPGNAFLHEKKRVIDLITKTRYWHKPTMRSMKTSLEKMKVGCKKYNINKIAMPRIGCGLDQLNWDEVRKLIKTIFSDTSVEIVVCYL